MKDRTGLPAGEPSDGERRFDSDAAQRILRRAAEEEARRDTDAADSYTLEQLQEIATEAGISPEAVAAAARAQASEHEEAGGWVAALDRLMPASWSPRLKHAVLIGAAVTLLGLFVSVTGIGPILLAVFAVVVALFLLLVLLGLGPF
jgi:hypothetical protein